jgi:hypothetical protein
MPILPEGARRLSMLDRLGNTPDEVAQALQSLHIQGARNTVRILNPIVKYVLAQLPSVLSVDVITGKTLRIVYSNGQKDEQFLPTAVMAFLDKFNRGEYPELEGCVASH